MDNFDRFGNKARGERMRLDKSRREAAAQVPKRKNKPRGAPAGATVSSHAPHELVEQLAATVKQSGESRSYIVVEAIRAGLPVVTERFKKAKANA